MATKRVGEGGNAEWVWDGASFAWELGPEPATEEDIASEEDRGVLIMLYDKDRLSSPQVKQLLSWLDLTPRCSS